MSAEVSIRCRNPRCKNWFLARVLNSEPQIVTLEVQTLCPNCKNKEWYTVTLGKPMPHPEAPSRSTRFKQKDGHWMFGMHDARSETPVFEHIDELNAVGRQDCANCAVVTLFGEAAFLASSPESTMRNRTLIEKYNITIGEWLKWGAEA